MQASLCRASQIPTTCRPGSTPTSRPAPVPRCARRQALSHQAGSASGPSWRAQCRDTACCSGEPAGPASSGAAADLGDEEFEGLLPEEDQEIPGNWMDAMSSNTKLGKAVRSAVEELRHLNDMELEQLQQADALLQKLGVKGSLFGTPEQQEALLRGIPDVEEEEEAEQM